MSFDFDAFNPFEGIEVFFTSFDVDLIFFVDDVFVFAFTLVDVTLVYFTADFGVDLDELLAIDFKAACFFVSIFDATLEALIAFLAGISNIKRIFIITEVIYHHIKLKF